MISITKDELDKYGKISVFTKFAIVYDVDDKFIYKIYKEYVREDTYNTKIQNPCLYKPYIKYYILKKRSKNLKYSDGIYDLIYVDGKFVGICGIKLHGKTLLELENEPLEKRIEISRELIKASKDLHKNLIYHCDYHLNNAFIVDSKLMLIDLDDELTHVTYIPWPYYRDKAIGSLGIAIRYYLGETKRYCYGYDEVKKLERNTKVFFHTYHGINDYINEVEKEKDIIFIEKDDDISFIRELKDKHDFKLVRIEDKEKIEKDEMKSIIKNSKINNIRLYDFVFRDNIGKYNNLETMNEGYIIEDKQLKRVYKR